MTDKSKQERESHMPAREGEAPRVSVKRMGEAASRFDERFTKGLSGGVGGALALFSTRLRKLLQSGHLQNYAFIVFAALIFAAAALVIYIRFFGR